MEDRIIQDEVVSEEVRAKIKTAVRDELSSKEGEKLVQEMSEATELATMAADNTSGMSRKAIIVMQRQAFKMAKRDRRLGRHVQHPQKKGRFDAIAQTYYANIGNLKIFTKKAVEYIDADFNETVACSAL